MPMLGLAMNKTAWSPGLSMPRHSTHCKFLGKYNIAPIEYSGWVSLWCVTHIVEREFESDVSCNVLQDGRKVSEFKKVFF